MVASKVGYAMNTRILFIVCVPAALLAACGSNAPAPVDSNSDAPGDAVADYGADLVSDPGLDSASSPDLTDEPRQDIVQGDAPIPTDTEHTGTDLAGVSSDSFSCADCGNDGDCPSGWSCLSTDGTERKCARPCNDGGDCPNGFFCGFLDGDLFCIPSTFNCVACMGDEPCGEGLCCDFMTGDCADCRGDCQTCTADYQCEAGSRCWKAGDSDLGVCTVECAAGGCPNPNFRCSVRADGVDVCEPDIDFCSPCQGLCTADFPVCAIVRGVEQCVKCATNADCDALFPDDGCTCSGDPLYACIDLEGNLCGVSTDGCISPCSVAGDCPPTADDSFLSCYVPDGGGAGTCYDPDGGCNSLTACCGPGMKCFDMTVFMEMISSGTLPRLIPHPVVDRSFCECDTTADCINGKTCTELSGYCDTTEYPQEFVDMMCPGGVLHTALPPRLCGVLTEFLVGRE